MSKDGLAKDFADAWADFTKDSEKAKQDILDVFQDAENDGEEDWYSFMMISTLGAIVVIFSMVILRYRFWG